MGKKETVDALVEGGKASAGPPIGSSLGPLKVNVGQIVQQINAKTAAFKGMKVPVKIIVDTETKEFEIEIGTPPVSQLIKKELSIELGSGEPNVSKVGVISIEQAIKIAKMKESSLLTKTLKGSVKNVVGSCQSMGVLVEGKEPKEMMKDIDAGKYDTEINAGKTETAADKLAKYADMSKKLEASKKARDKEKEAAKAAEEAAKVAAAQAAPAAGATPAAGAAAAKPGAPAPAAKAAAPAKK
jgi:large subunit ribosomal protein L11